MHVLPGALQRKRKKKQTSCADKPEMETSSEEAGGALLRSFVHLLQSLECVRAQQKLSPLWLPAKLKHCHVAWCLARSRASEPPLHRCALWLWTCLQAGTLQRHPQTAT